MVRKSRSHQQPDSWTVVWASGEMVDPIDRYLSHLTAVGRSPNTIRSYAFDLRDLFVFLEERGVSTKWNAVTPELLGDFVLWLRHGYDVRGGVISAHPTQKDALSTATIRRKLSAASSFYDFYFRSGKEIDPNLWRTVRDGWPRGETTYKPLLTHLGAREQREFAVKVRRERHQPATLTDTQVGQVLDATGNRRDRLFIRLLAETGLRAGEALGLRHEDLDFAGRAVRVRKRTNENSARAKTKERQIPTSSGLLRLYSDYLHRDYGEWDCDYVFIILSGISAGHAWNYNSLNSLVRRLRQETDLYFTPHTFRHTFATNLLRQGVRMEIVQYLMGHSSVATTSDTYAHLKAEDARRALEATGWFDKHE